MTRLQTHNEKKDSIWNLISGKIEFQQAWTTAAVEDNTRPAQRYLGISITKSSNALLLATVTLFGLIFVLL